MESFTPDKPANVVFHDFIIEYHQRNIPRMQKLVRRQAVNYVNETNHLAFFAVCDAEIYELPKFDTSILGADEATFVGIGYEPSQIFAVTDLLLYKDGKRYNHESEDGVSGDWYSIISGPELPVFIENPEYLPLFRDTNNQMQFDINRYVNEHRGRILHVPDEELGRLMVHALEFEKTLPPI